MAYFIQGSRHPVVFLANPRTGSNAVANALQTMGGVAIGEHHEEPDDYPDDALIVHTVRNHLDVLISYWIRKAKGYTFPEFIDIVISGEHPRFPPLMLYNNWNVKPNFILKYETLDYEFSNLCVCAGLPDIQLVRSKNSVRAPEQTIENMFTSDLMKKIINYYGTEMGELGYGNG
jgi:hypothetical protein